MKISQHKTALIIGSVAFICLLAGGIAMDVSCFNAPGNNINNPLPTATPPATTIFPVITDVHTDNISANSATVVWDTDIPATSEVEYWIEGSAVKLVAVQFELVTHHSILLAPLQNETEYHFLVKSSSESSALSVAAEPGVFTTGEGIIPQGAEVGYKAPDFTLTDINGETVSLADSAGKWRILVLWETNCSACRSQLAHLQAYYEAMPSDVALLSINVGEETDVLVISLLKSRGVTYPVLMDRDGSVAEAYEMLRWPSNFFIDGGGVIRKVVQGRFNDAEEIAAALNSAKGSQ